VRTVRLTLLILFVSAGAKANAGVGAALGTQVYESDPIRLIFAADLLLEHSHLGVEAAGEYTNQKRGGRFTALHFDATYRINFGQLFILFGAGPTQIHSEAGDLSESTWNAQIQAILARRQSCEVFWRIRYYEYGFNEFRGEKTSPATPALFLGIRFRTK
jgi:hypothetical protein